MPNTPDLPTAEEREWLIEQMALLIAACGPEPFLAAPILDDSPRYFPDEGGADPAGIQVVARRLLWHAGIRDLRAKVLDLRDVEVPEERGQLRATELWFADIIENVVELEMAKIGDDDITGLLCHEIGVAFRAVRRLDSVGGSPFRTAPDDLQQDDARKAALGSLATVYLGFGLLAANASHSVRHSGEVRGYSHSVEWHHQRAGGLPPQAMSFLCALHAVVRGEEEAYRALSRNQADDFRAWCEALRPERASLIEQLGLPPEAEWPPPRAETVKPFNDEHYESGDALTGEEREHFNAGAPVFRLRRHRTFLYAVLGTVLGFPASWLLGFLTSRSPGSALVVFMVAGYVAGGLFGRRVRAPDRCSDLDCGAILTPDLTECPRCGGIIAGEIAKLSDLRDAEERWRAEHGMPLADPDEPPYDEEAAREAVEIEEEEYVGRRG